MALNRNGILKYRADWRPVALVTGTFLACLVPFCFDFPLAANAALAFGLIYFRSYGPYAQHNHAHLAAFNWAPLNRVYDFLLTQLTGYPTSQWELHHNRGHHRHYLNPELDVARIVNLKTGRPMPRWWYAVRGNLTIARDSWKIGLAERRAGKKSLLAKWTVETTAQAAFTAAILWWSPWKALAFFIVPNVFSALFIWWESYPHHHDTPGTHVYDGSVTTLSGFFNHESFNIGHHTAHHERPTLHWSLLPARTAEIAAQLPSACVQRRRGDRYRKPSFPAEDHLAATLVQSPRLASGPTSARSSERAAQL
jgi:fatty acid desaturase